MMSAKFIEGGAGEILVVSHDPDIVSDRVTVVLPAFAEEMNKSRRLVWEVGQRLAEKGERTIVPDLFGTGDSEGEFCDSRWAIWLDDLRAVFACARSGGAQRIQLLAIRLGATFCADLVNVPDMTIERVITWAPVRKGRDALVQMLRMKSLAMRMAGQRSSSTDEMLQSLLTGTEPVELGGYDVCSELANSIDNAGFSEAALSEVESGLTLDLGAVAPGGDEIEVKSSPWQNRHVEGERFWMVVEPGSNPDLVKETVEFLSG